MKPKFYKEYFILFVLLTSMVSTAISQEFGLQFNGQNKTLDERTGLDLSPEDYLSFQDEFEISFEIKSREYFGYVFRLINKNNKNIDLLSQYGDSRDLNIVVGGRNTVIPIDLQVPKSLWSHVAVKVDLISKRIILTIDTKTFYVENIEFQSSDAFKLFFGGVDYNEFTTLDVPKMSIRNIKIKTDEALVLHYPLDETTGVVARDIVGNKQAIISNPVWISPLHSIWKEIAVRETNGVVLEAADEARNRLYLLSNEKLIVCNLKNNRIQEVLIKNNQNDLTIDNKIVYNTNDGFVYCYSIDRKSVTKLNPKSGVWADSTFVNSTFQNYQNHNKYFSKEENTIYMFGGYGQHKYTNEIQKLNLNTGLWTAMKSNDSVYTPRYLSAVGALNDTLYLFGGYGSVSGDQMINPKSNYDLLGYSLKDNNFFKKFEVSRIVEGMAVASNMWIDGESRSYHALVFDKHLFNGELQLVKGDLDSNKIEKMGSSIPFRFRDIKSNETLFYLPSEKKLIAYTSFLKDSITTEFSIRSINYPPNKWSEDVVVETFYAKYGFILLLGGFIVLIVFLVFYNKKKLKKKSVILPVDKQKIVIVENPDDKDIAKPVFVRKASVTQSVYDFLLFGGFQVFDKESKDITNKFSPLLKELFLLIWLNTLKNNKGVSPEKIGATLWYDKSPKSAQNNRAVNIAKIRGILTEIGDYKLTKETGYWKIIHNENKPKSDYFDVLQITSLKKEALSKDKIDYLIEIANKGPFLLNLTYEWLDGFKANVSDAVIDTLVSFADNFDINTDPEFIITLSDCLFKFDSINEEAMVFKCKAQYIMGKHSLAKSTYEKFEKEYELLYGQKFEMTFKDIIKERD